MSLRLSCGTAGIAFGQQNIVSSNQPKQWSQRLNSLCSGQDPTHIEQLISLISTELQIILPLEYPWSKGTFTLFVWRTHYSANGTFQRQKANTTGTFPSFATGCSVIKNAQWRGNTLFHLRMSRLKSWKCFQIICLDIFCNKQQFNGRFILSKQKLTISFLIS